MEVYVKESLYVLDYNNNKVDAIFLSDDHLNAGYAYDITIKEENTGYSDLQFTMPDTIIDDNGLSIKNPKLALLVPLVKLRYERTVTYAGDKEIVVQEPQGYGDTTTYVPKTYSPVYPYNIIEHYVMDYIVQPIDKQRSGLKIDPTFTAIDYPRYNLSKKKVGLEITDSTVTREEWSLYTGEPYSVDGTVKYVKWTQAMSDRCNIPGLPDIPTTFDAKNASHFPLWDEHFDELNIKAGAWPYGYNGTAFYWPVTSTGRYQGKLFKEGDFLVLRMYDFYDGVDIDKDIVPTVVWDNTRYSADWSQLHKTSALLSPNNALNYLRYVLENTNWTIATRPDGTPDVDIEKKEVPTPAGSTSKTELKDSTCQLSLSNSNCYNAITAICQGLQLYPIFDCEKRTVALRLFAGKNYGLTYSLGRNINSETVKMDGEKVITKLYVSGGKDYKGDSNIHIGTATREYTKHCAGFYASETTLPNQGYIYAIVDKGFTSADFTTVQYDSKLNTKTVTTHDVLVKEYWRPRGERSVYFFVNSKWVKGTQLSTGNWQGVVNGVTYIVDPISGAEGTWDPNDDIYISQRSPWGTNYIINLKWAYQNNWITKEQILGLYQINQKVHNLNTVFVNKYTEDRLKTQEEYNKAKNNYDIAQDEYESTINNMMAKYYNDNDDYTKGTTRCFHVYPLDVEVDTANKIGHIRMFHCYKCGETSAYSNGQAKFTMCPKCKSTGDLILNDSIPVHRYSDFTFKYTKDMYPKTRYEGYQYNPHVKGSFLRLVTTLDCRNKPTNNSTKKDYTIEDYEGMISIVNPIQYRGAASSTFDGYDYEIGGVYVKSSSGQIENWNEAIKTYITAYGKALDYLEEVKIALGKIDALNQLYNKWNTITDSYYAEIQEKYGDYIVEGDYKNDEQPYVGLLFNEGLEASDKFSTPEITYTLDVIDSSGLIEYRLPTINHSVCEHCGYINKHYYLQCPACGSKIFTNNTDTYNDLVHTLHNIGQIVPHPGDYCKIYDEKMGMFGVPALITEVVRVLDKPHNNKLNLDTSYTDDETLVGNIITATNTVLNNSDIYARTSVLNADGTMDGNSIKNTLENASGSDITIVGTNGSILLNGSGLRATDPNNENRAMKYAGNGIFCTTNLQPENGEAIFWDKLMTPTGINANYINAGTIDAHQVNIVSGLSGKVILDQYGLNVKSDAASGSHITAFNTADAKKDATYADNWGKENNIASFIGVDANNNPLIYTKGFLVAEEGSNIANWITSNNGFYHLNGNTKDVILSPNGLDGYLLKVKDKLTVDTNGNTYIKGKIVVDTSDSSMNTGTVGGWTASSNGLYKGTLVLSPSGGAINGAVHDSGVRTDWALFMNSNFGVLTDGTTYMTNAHVKGDIYASSGTFNGTVYASDGSFSGTISTTNLSASGTVTINDAIITKATLSSCSISAAQINSGTFDSARIPSLSAGKISGGTITSSDIHLNGGTVKLCSTGRVEFSNSTGFFSMGPTSPHSGAAECKHPYVSALNIAYSSSGISFRDSDGIDATGNEIAYIKTSGFGTGKNSLALKAKAGGIYLRNDSNGLLFDGHSIYANDGIDSSSNRAHITMSDNMYIIPNESSHKCYYGPGGKSSWAVTDEIATKGFSPSTLNIKENVKKKDTSKLLDVLSNIELYEYNYIKDVEDGKQDYGYIIDYIEKIPGIKDYIDFIPSTINGHDTKQINNEQLTKFLLGAVIELNKEIKQIKKESE